MQALSSRRSYSIPQKYCVLAGLTTLIVAAGCAEGGGLSGGAIALGDIPGTDPDAVDPGNARKTPCDQDADVPCSCDDGRQGLRTCLVDWRSPAFGYLSECGSCADPSTGGSGTPDPSAKTEADAGSQAKNDMANADAKADPSGPPGDAGSPDTGTPVPADNCQDSRKNGKESDVDCGGGTCAACEPNQACNSNEDCAAGSRCAAYTCGPIGTPGASNFVHEDYIYDHAVDWSCAGVTRFDSSGNGTWSTTTSCSQDPEQRPEVTCGVAQTSGGPEVCILRARGLVLGAGHTLELVGGRPVILAVEGDATIDGRIDASAQGTTPGAGGNLDCTTSAGGAGSGNPAKNEGASGGGGGGFGTAGGSAGQANTDASQSPTVHPGGAGGEVRGSALLSPLQGGCPGGLAGGCGLAGGAGGGAIQIAASGTLVITGEVWANGGDGSVPCGPDAEGGGTGGGAGGGILLQATSLDASTASLGATGGVGGNSGAYAGSFDCGGEPGGAGATKPAELGGDSRECQTGSPGGGGGYGRLVY